MNNNDCNLNDCPFLPKDGDKDDDGKEIKTTNLCNDPSCSNVAETKIIDMHKEIFQLENILRAMTGLCRDPQCTSKSPSVTKRINDSVPPLPVPTRYYTDDLTPQKETEQKVQNLECKKTCPESKKEDSEEIQKICKGPVCYGAYMGYKKEPVEKDTKPCGSYSCIAKAKEVKNICAAPTCPFSKKDDLVDKYGLFSDTPKTTVGPCGGFTCPAPKLDFLSTPKPDLWAMPKTDYFSSAQNNILSDLKPSYIPKTSHPCNMQTCPLASQNVQAVGLCGRTSCPFASVEYAQDLAFNNTNYGLDDTQFSPSNQYKPSCGKITCPYNNQQNGPPQVGLCGRTSCPYASITPNVNTRTTAPCGNTDCIYGDVSYDPVGLCGQPNCPMMNKTSPGAVQPCPYADSIKRYPCGSPSCPHVNPSGMLHTHEYTNDKSYVQEASRPYCGSASPFDYLSSLTPTYPMPYSNNYALFDYTEPPSIPPCPYLPKKNKKTCGKPTCPYAEGNEIPEKENFCIDQTCLYREGTCGGIRKYSCETKDVEHCESPDCKVQLKKKKCCKCGGTKHDDYGDDYDDSPRQKHGKSCTCRAAPKDDSNEDYDYGDTRKHKHRKRSPCSCITDEVEEDVNGYESPKRDDCGRPECHIPMKKYYEETGESTSDPDKCTSKTCPYLKSLVLCEDCGGVLPDEMMSTSRDFDSANFFQTTEGTTVYITEDGEDGEESPMQEDPSMKSDTPVKAQKYVFEEQAQIVAPPPASLYDYPGVQIGHRECEWRRRRVPKNMGWLWNCVPTFGNPEFWRGYKPGAVLRSVYKIIKKNRRDGADVIDIKKKKRGRKGMIDDLKHCIEIKKKEGEYAITVLPVKDPKTRDPFDLPYLDCTPIQFKIEKEKKDPNFCPCDEVEEKDSDSEFEFHFTPPAAIPETNARKKKIMAERDAQYDIMDLPPELRAQIKGSKSKASKGKSEKRVKKGKKK